MGLWKQGLKKKKNCAGIHFVELHCQKICRFGIGHGHEKGVDGRANNGAP